MTLEDFTDKELREIKETPVGELVNKMVSQIEEVAETSMSPEEIENFLKENPACREVFPDHVWNVDASQIPDFTNTPFGETLGSAREEVFRGVGEGSGKSHDLTSEIDNNFNHLVYLDDEGLGAYRYTWGKDMLKNRGVDGFYNSSLLNFETEFQDENLNKSMELTRFFGKTARTQLYLFPAMQKLCVERREKDQDAQFLLGTVTLSSNIPLEWQKRFVYLFQESTKNAGIFNPDSVSAKNPENEITFSKTDKQELERFFKEKMSIKDILTYFRNKFLEVFDKKSGKENKESSTGKNSLADRLTHLRSKFLENFNEESGVEYPMLFESYIRLVEEGGVQFGTAVQNPLRSANEENVNIKNPSVEVLMVIDLEKLSEAADARFIKIGKRIIKSPVPSLRDTFLKEK